jgi:hypothetical protein
MTAPGSEKLHQWPRDLGNPGRPDASSMAALGRLQTHPARASGTTAPRVNSIGRRPA